VRGKTDKADARRIARLYVSASCFPKGIGSSRRSFLFGSFSL
jgi:hypothetical protein